MNITAWTQWSDLPDIPGVDLRNPSNFPLESSDLSVIDFYVPSYMTGKGGLDFVLKMPNLKYLQMPNAGYDDAMAYVRPGITLCNATGVHDDSTAELAVGLALAARRGFAEFAKDQSDAKWNHRRFPSFSDSKIGLIGYGSIGQTIAKNLSGFSVEVFPFSKSGRDGSLKIDELDDYLPSLDIVILILPLTPESKHMFDSRRLALMKDGALIVNVARGPIIDTDALVSELNSGRLSAALDVTDPEPLPNDHPLWKAKNVLIVPHVGGDSTAFEPRARQLVVSQLNRLVAGEPLINVIVDGN
ncbi:MAG: 2-hydroxyacid dehydrogenase [Actinobacteria bacterium]|nr:2-hydroxyacid dehydrogenase [Actinomycetota bacterium]